MKTNKLPYQPIYSSLPILTHAQHAQIAADIRKAHNEKFGFDPLRRQVASFIASALYHDSLQKHNYSHKESHAFLVNQTAVFYKKLQKLDLREFNFYVCSFFD